MSRQYRRHIVAVALTCWASIGFADHYVAQNGQTPVSPYTSWDSAASNIQEAVGAAAAGGTVWVTNGPYLAMPGSNDVVLINKSLTLRGNSAQPASVVIDGGGAARGINVNLAAPAIVLVDGFSITNCRVTASGAGIYLNHTAISSGTGIVQNCVISQNEVTGNSGGGGLRSYGQTAASTFVTVLSNCVFAGNLASTGGGIQFQNTRASILYCRIEGNTSTNMGGGCYAASAGGYFYKSAIVSNRSDNAIDTGGGGLYFHTGVDGTFDRCEIAENEASFMHGGGMWTRSSVSLTNCIIHANRALAPGKGWGGGILAHSSTPHVNFYNCLFTDNAAQSGGGFYGYNTATTTCVIVNCTIVSNTTWSTYGGGIGLAGTNAILEVRNSIINGNTRTNSFTHSAANYGFASGNNPGTKAFYQCDTLPFPASYDGGGNITNDPQYVNAAAGDYRLLKTSPCINKGINQEWMNSAPDLDGKVRVDVFYHIVDMGCFEFQPPSGTVLAIR